MSAKMYMEGKINYDYIMEEREDLCKHLLYEVQQY